MTNDADHGTADHGTAGERPDAPVWRKSPVSNPSGDCVELAGLANDRVAMRNSREPGGSVLVFARAEVRALVEGIKDGEFDDLLLPAHHP